MVGAGGGGDDRKSSSLGEVWGGGVQHVLRYSFNAGHLGFSYAVGGHNKFYPDEL